MPGLVQFPQFLTAVLLDVDALLDEVLLEVVTIGVESGVVLGESVLVVE